MMRFKIMTQRYNDLNIDLDEVLNIYVNIPNELDSDFVLVNKLSPDAFNTDTYGFSCNGDHNYIAWHINHNIPVTPTCPSNEMVNKNYMSIVEELSEASIYPPICDMAYILFKDVYYGLSRISNIGAIITKRPAGTLVDLIIKSQKDRSINLLQIYNVVETKLKKMINTYNIGIVIPFLIDIIYYDSGEIYITPNITVTRFPNREEYRKSFLDRVDGLLKVFKFYISLLREKPEQNSRSLVEYNIPNITFDSILEKSLENYKKLPIFKQKVNFLWNGKICDELSIKSLD